MTKKELTTAVKQLGGTNYSKLNKQELERYYNALQEEQNKEKQKEEQIQMKNNTLYYDTKTSNQITENNSKLSSHVPTDNQWNYMNYMLKNYSFPSELADRDIESIADMSRLLHTMENQIRNGKVEKIQTAANKPKTATKKQTNRTTDKQKAYLQKLAKELSITITVPKDKEEASKLIRNLDDKVQKQRFQAQKESAATQEPKETTYTIMQTLNKLCFWK